MSTTSSDMPTPRTNGTSSLTLSIWDPSLDSIDPLYSIWQSTLTSSGWPISGGPEKLQYLLTQPDCTTFLARSSSPSSGDTPAPVIGFVLTNTMPAFYKSDLRKGCLALLLVDPAHQGQGVGTALHEKAVAHLKEIVQASLPEPYDQEPSASRRSLMLGAIFPRIFPGLPVSLGEGVKSWFAKRGWVFGEQESIDLYQAVPEGGVRTEKGEALLKRMDEVEGVRYGVMEVGKEKELMEFQKREFELYPGWVSVFPAFIDGGKIEDIFCAYEKESGKIIGALVASDEAMHRGFAFPGTLGKKTGAISVVGVASDSRKKGTGLGMVVAATNHLADLGVDGIFIDWVILEGFYEKAGYKEWRRYWNQATLNVC